MATNIANQQTPEEKPRPGSLFGDLANAARRGLAPANAPAPVVPAPQGKGRKRVLLVEGDWPTRLILQHKLRRAGLEVEVALNGCLAVQKLQSSELDAILTESSIGGIQATELITEARQNKKFSKRPIYVFTGEVRGRNNAVEGATKVFNKLSNPPDEVVKEIATTLLGEKRAVRVEPSPIEEVEIAAIREIPELLKDSVAELGKELRALAQKADGPEVAVAKWVDLWAQVRSVASCASVAGMRKLARETAALYAFVNDLCVQPKWITNSSYHTAGVTADVLDALASGLGADPEPPLPEFAAVLVNEGSGSGTNFGDALLGAGFKPVSFANSAQALGHLASHKADLVVVHAAKSDGNGLDVCKKIHEFPIQQNTPVIFVASGSNLNQPLAESGGDIQLVIEPVAGAEVALRALNLVQGDLGPNQSAPPAPSVPVAPEWDQEEVIVDAATGQPANMVVPELRGEPAEMESEEAGAAEADADLEESPDVPDAQADSAESPVEAVFEPEAASVAQAPAEMQAKDDAADGKGLEEELTELRLERLSLQGKLTAEQQVSVAYRRRVEELEKRLRDYTAKVEAELATTKAGQNGSAGSNRHVEELEHRLRENGAELERANAALREKSEHLTQVQGKLAGVLRERDEHQSRRNADQEAAAQSNQRAAELEGRLRNVTGELDRLKTDLKKQAEERQHLEAELRGQINTARTATEKAEATLKEKLEQSNQLRGELDGLRKERDELKGRLTGGQQTVAESNRRMEDLEKRLRDNAAELERTKADLKKLAEERQRLEAELRGQINSARTATEKAEASLKEKLEQSNQLRGELDGLRKERDELKGKLTGGQQTIAESNRRAQELEGRLRDSSGELDRLKTDLKKQAEERQRLEAELRGQINTSRTATEKAEATLKEKLEQSNQLRGELDGLRKERDELKGKLTGGQQTAAESNRRIEDLEKRLRDNVAELDRAKADLKKQADERQRLEAELRGQINTSRTATEKAEATLKEKLEQSNQLRSELDGLRKERDELKGKLTGGQQAAAESNRRIEELEKRLRDNTAELDRAKADLKKHAEEQQRLKAESGGQINNARAAAEKAEAALKEKLEQSNQLRGELENLRRERDELKGKLTGGQQNVAESKRRIEVLEKQLLESAIQLEEAKADLKKQADDRQRLESELRKQLTVAKSAVEQAEETQKERAPAQFKSLQQELANLREERHQLHVKYVAEQQGNAKSARRIQEFDKVETELRAKLEAAKSEARQAGAARNEQTAKCSRLEAELAELRQANNDLASKLAAAPLARVTAELERERADRRRIEQRAATLASQLQESHGQPGGNLELEQMNQARVTELEKQLRERDDKIARLHADLEKEISERQLVEEHVRATGDLSSDLRKNLSLFEEAKGTFQRTQEDLESRLKATRKALSESEARAQREAGERQRLAEALEEAQRSLQEHAQRSEMELSKLASTLQLEQLERKRLESDAAQRRFASLDSARASRALLNNLRHHIQQPVNDLVQSTCRLLEIELPDDQKKLVEAVLENTLHLQISLKDAENLNVPSDPAGNETQSAADTLAGPGSASPPAAKAAKPTKKRTTARKSTKRQ